MIELNILVLPSGRQLTHTLETGQTLSLGREQGDLRFADDGQMSSFHLTIVAEESQIHFQDEGSTNGTFLNGRRLSSGTAGDGDELNIGQTRIELALRRVARPKPAVVRESSGSAKTVLEIEGSHAAVKQIMPGQTLSVGRTDRADWTFPDDDLLSGLHFVLSAEGDDWEVVDARSSNGTFVNGHAIERAVLKSGDRITAGDTQFQIRLLPLDAAKPPLSSTFFRESSPPAQLSSADTQPSAPSGDTQPGQWSAPRDPTGYIWLISADPSRTTWWIKPGSSIGITHRHGESDAPSMVLDWTGTICRVSASDKRGELKVNNQLTSQAELQSGDQLFFDGCAYHIQFTEDLRVPSWPQAHVETAASGEQPDGSERLSERVGDLVGDLVGELVDEQAAEPSDELPIADIKTAEITLPVVAAQRRDLAPAAAGKVEDLIAFLMDQLDRGPMWLVTVDSQYPQQPSVPVPVEAGDASWMLQVEAGWPKNLFLVLLAHSTAEQLLGTLLEQVAEGCQLTAPALDLWLSKSGRLPLGPITEIWTIEGPTGLRREYA